MFVGISNKNDTKQSFFERGGGKNEMFDHKKNETLTSLPLTTPIPHARLFVGYICGLWVFPPPPLCVNLPSAKTFFIAAILLWEKDDVGFLLFYSVIYNSVSSGMQESNNFLQLQGHRATQHRVFSTYGLQFLTTVLYCERPILRGQSYPFP